MKKKSGNKIGLGVFVTVTMFLFMVALYYIGKKQQLFNDTFQISGVFKDVKGLQVGNNVRFAGINVGVVENIEIASDSTVKVDLTLNESVKKFIKKNATAIIGSDGLMGSTLLIIRPGTNGEKVIENNDYIATVMPVSVDDILVKLKVTGDNAASITDDLAVLMDNIREGRGTIGKLFMDPVFAANIDKTVVNLKQGAGGFSKNMEAAKHSFLLRTFFKDKKDKDKKTGKEPEKKSWREKRLERKEKRKQERERNENVVSNAHN